MEKFNGGGDSVGNGSVVQALGEGQGGRDLFLVVS